MPVIRWSWRAGVEKVRMGNNGTERRGLQWEESSSGKVQSHQRLQNILEA
jgi:hypothetical protein